MDDSLDASYEDNEDHDDEDDKDNDSIFPPPPKRTPSKRTPSKRPRHSSVERTPSKRAKTARTSTEKREQSLIQTPVRRVPTTRSTTSPNPTRNPNDQNEYLQAILNNLISYGRLRARDKLEFLGSEGLITRDGWIEDLELQETFPSLSVWCDKVARSRNQKWIKDYSKKIVATSTATHFSGTLEQLRDHYYQGLGDHIAMSSSDDVTQDTSDNCTPATTSTTTTTTTTTTATKKAELVISNPEPRGDSLGSPTIDTFSDQHEPPSEENESQQKNKREEDISGNITNSWISTKKIQQTEHLHLFAEEEEEEEKVKEFIERPSKREQELQKEKKEKLEKEKKDKLEKEKKDKLEKEKKEKLEKEEKEKLEKDKRERLEREKANLEKEKLEREKKEKLEKEKERYEKERLETERKERLETEKRERRENEKNEKLEKERREKLEKERRAVQERKEKETTEKEKGEKKVKQSEKRKEKEKEKAVDSPPHSPSLEYPASSSSLASLGSERLYNHERYASFLEKANQSEIQKKQGQQDNTSKPTSTTSFKLPETSSKTVMKSSATIGQTTPRKPVILGTGLKSQMLAYIQMLVEKLGGKLVDTYDGEVTHLVGLVDDTGCVRRTIKYCQAILAGAWVVSFDWIMKSFSAMQWVGEGEFQVKGDIQPQNAPQKARLSLASGGQRLLKGYKFYLWGKFESPSKEEVSALVFTGYGRMIPSLPSAPLSTSDMMTTEARHTIILGHPSFSHDDSATRSVFFQCGRHPVSLSWLLDSITHYTTLPLENYYLLQEESSDYPLHTQNSMEI